MQYRSIDDIYTANDAIREKLKQTVTALSAEQISALPEGEKWTLAQFVEHISIVGEGVAAICSKLLSKAEAAGLAGDGTVNISNEFMQQGSAAANVKLEAPERVQPNAGATVEESFTKLDASRAALESLREKFTQFDGTQAKFPHPFFGDLSAQEWLVLSGGHEARHLKQMRLIIEKLS